MMQAAFGTRLRGWRRSRRWSQEELAGRAEVSSRHVSFLETGRSMPSREMVLKLCRHLEVPLRERNQLLTAAGFAASYRESALSDDALTPIREALEFLIAQHEPYPAVVLDRYWDVRLANRAAMAMTALIAPAALMNPPMNVVRLLFDPKLGTEDVLVNREEVQAHMLKRLRDEAEQLDADKRQRAFHAEMAAFAPGVVEEETSHPLLPLHMRVAGFDAKLYTAITTLGTPTDVTLQELRIETYFPADAASAAALRALAV